MLDSLIQGFSGPGKWFMYAIAVIFAYGLAIFLERTFMYWIKWNKSKKRIEQSIQSGDFDISMSQGGGADIRGDGEYMMKIRRVIPDFLQQTGSARVTLNLKNYPTDTEASSSLGPFTIDSDTTKVDTRARARAIALKIDNTSITQHWKVGTFRLDIQPDGRR